MRRGKGGREEEEEGEGRKGGREEGRKGGREEGRKGGGGGGRAEGKGKGRAEVMGKAQERVDGQGEQQYRTEVVCCGEGCRWFAHPLLTTLSSLERSQYTNRLFLEGTAK